ncbi:Beta-1,3-N-acetylglucosaminyltransferase lunatic fringe [Geodia barretti]|uniref:Beta-1,3-N-acetylglucosaminyltransferase lunatic fringe n=1 Tax=Geodia barretti TaxID=519541 RepID=A0AA35X7R4_GEOBA|nr:Beta-1,3-N-acetylglucosaminyltransferase lunatic fringe [Geodia barretti]
MDYWTSTAEEFGTYGAYVQVLHFTFHVFSSLRNCVILLSSGFKVATADGCSVGHCRECLCCKSGVEYEQFYRERDRRSHFKWFCHVDDDVYVNIHQLVILLHKYDPLTEKVYLGRWSLARTSKLQMRRNIPNLKSNEFAFGTGALYCISSCLMTELEPYFRGSQRFVSMCKLLQYTDDMTVGATIESILGYNFTDVDLIFSELHAISHIPASKLPSLISISYGKNTLPGGGEIKRHVSIPQPQFTLDEDPTRFLSFHCLLYSSTSWCR